MTVQIEPGWKKILADELKKEYFCTLTDTVHKLYTSTETEVFPPQELIFNAFDQCHFDDVKVVILGQDPYHGTGQAHGLSFSVPDGVKIPPSLRNIYKEISADTSLSGNLERWATQGVLLLNSVLTVEASKPASHQGIGWETFTDAVIQEISDRKEQVVFLLWGKYAQTKGQHIDTSKHLVLTAPHPSPFSAHTGFFGCNHFKKTNNYLKAHGQSEIHW